MPASSPTARLFDIIEAIGLIRAETIDITLQAFQQDKRKRWLVERGREIISEASRRLPDQLKARHPQIPWPKLAAIGNILRHAYEHIAPDILWRVAKDDLSILENACCTELSAQQPSS